MSECDVNIMVNTPNKTSEPVLKKRVNQWSHEVRKIISINPERTIPNLYGDRFIPRRYAIKGNETNEVFLFKGGKEDVLTAPLSPRYCSYRGLKIFLNASFGIKPRRLLQFSDLEAKASSLSNGGVLPAIFTYEFIYGNLNAFDWPCTPRLKPVACQDTTHDLPHLDMFSDFNLIDWSVDGQIAALFGEDLVLWMPLLDLTLIYRIRNVKCIASCPQGKYLAISSMSFGSPIIELWDVQNYKELSIRFVHFFENNRCLAPCIEWAPSGKVVLCGTEMGWLYVFSASDLTVIRVLKNHKQSVFMIKFSPTMRYMATSDVEGNVYVYNWPSCDIHVVLRSQRKLRVVIDWHPWNGTDLAISEDFPASIVILHAPTREIVAYYQRKDKKVVIDFITFSKLTGELLVSYSDKDSDGCVHSEILVMSSLDRVVDILRVADNCARFIMWNPNGMQLATAGNDETLTIWNFLPNRDKNRFGPSVNKIRKLHSEIKESKNVSNLNYGREFSKWLSIK